jgi:pSer/pThr/pTyr-binding forkhead associated (FHA) protein
MKDKTIINSSKIGQRLEAISRQEKVSYLMFNNAKIPLVATISIGRASDSKVVIDGMLASRNHAIIQKIKNDYYIKDMNSTNGTFLNGEQIPSEKYVKLKPGDTISIANTHLILH